MGGNGGCVPEHDGHGDQETEKRGGRGLQVEERRGGIIEDMEFPSCLVHVPHHPTSPPASKIAMKPRTALVHFRGSRAVCGVDQWGCR